MRSYWLVQRLNKSFRPDQPNPFAFGGGKIFGGFNREMYLEVLKLFEFDYMGSAEFEFGAVPEAFAKAFENMDEYIDHTVYYKDIPIYVWCNKNIVADVEKFINGLLYDKGDRNLKERTGLQIALDEADTTRRVGWLELGEAFFFFKCKQTFENTKQFFSAVAAKVSGLE